MLPLNILQLYLYIYIFAPQLCVALVFKVYMLDVCILSLAYWGNFVWCHNIYADRYVKWSSYGVLLFIGDWSASSTIASPPWPRPSITGSFSQHQPAKQSATWGDIQQGSRRKHKGETRIWTCKHQCWHRQRKPAGCQLRRLATAIARSSSYPQDAVQIQKEQEGQETRKKG